MRYLFRLIPVMGAAALFAGCGGSPSAINGPGAIPQSRSIVEHAGPGRSWILPEAKSHDLLCVSDGGNLYIFSYPDGYRVGEVSGVDSGALCSDKKGHVFATSTEEILEFKHGGTGPIKTLHNPGWSMLACSVDSVTGDLAVVNFESIKGYEPGGVSIFRKAKGSPGVYSDASMNDGVRGGSYDGSGNIFIDGDDSFNFQFAELPRKSIGFTTIGLNGTIESPGGIQWDGKYVVVADAFLSVLYQTDGAGGDVIGSTTLNGAGNLSQYFIDPVRGIVVGANTNGQGDVSFWPYPAGGNATLTLTGFKQPSGVTVSFAHHR